MPKDGECLEDVPKGPWAGDFTKNSGLKDRKKSELDLLRLSVVQRGCLRLSVVQRGCLRLSVVQRGCLRL